MRIQSLLSALVLGAMLTPSAAALSCARADIGERMEKAKASEDLYYVLSGTFTRVTPLIKKPGGPKSTPDDFRQTRPPEITSARFNGVGLTQAGQSNVELTDFRVDIETRCMGPWCGNVPQGERDLIAFVMHRPGQAPLLKISPCPENTYAADREGKQIQKLKNCFDAPCEIVPPEYRRR